MRRAIALLLLAAAASAEESPTLSQCTRWALEVSERVALSDAEIRQAEALYRNVRSGVLPQVRLEGVERWEDGGSAGTQEDRRYNFHGSQLLFSGFRELRAMQGQKAEIESRGYAAQRARQLLHEEVAGVFYTIVDLDLEIASLQALEAASTDRVKDLNRRVNLGRSRESEVLSAQVQQADVRARLADARGLRASALEVLSFLVGRPAAGVTDDTPDPSLPALGGLLDGLSARPDVQAASAAVRSAELFLRAARGGYWPTVDAAGNAYLERTGGDEEGDWDAAVFLNAPLFQGGRVRAEVEEAAVRRDAALLEESQTRRLAAREVRARWQELARALEQTRYLKEASDLAERNLTVQQGEYRLGLVDNLQVLAALNTLLQSRGDYIRARSLAKLNAVRLSVAAGRVP